MPKAHIEVVLGMTVEEARAVLDAIENDETPAVKAAAEALSSAMEDAGIL